MVAILFVLRVNLVSQFDMLESLSAKMSGFEVSYRMRKMVASQQTMVNIKSSHMY
jgi:hypothetical protein